MALGINRSPRAWEPAAEPRLEIGSVYSHPFVVGEIACGDLRNRTDVLSLLGRLPRVPSASDDEVLEFAERRDLPGRGVGWIDAHLLAATFLAGSARIWTRDRRLARVAGELGVLHEQ